MLTKLLLNASGLVQPLWRPDTPGTDTPSGGIDSAPIPPAGAGAGQMDSVPPVAAGSDSVVAGAGADTTTGGEVKPTPVDWRERRMQELSGMNAKLKQRAAELEQQNAALTAKTTPAGAPAGRTYTPAEFEAAVQEQARGLSAVQLFDQKCNETGAAGMRDFPDFKDKLETLKAATQLDPVFLEQAWEIGDAHRILYELGKDPVKGMEIMAMRPTQRAVALAKLSAELGTRPKPTKVSAAPPPNPAAVGTTTGGAAPLENIQNISDWMKERDKQVADRQAARRGRR